MAAYAAAAVDGPAQAYEGSVIAGPAVGVVASFRLVPDPAAAAQGAQVLVREPAPLQPDGTTSVDGLAGYFTATLYGDVQVDSRHTSASRNAYHWEAFFFPFLRNGEADSEVIWQPGLRLTVQRHCASAEADGDGPVAALWYTWTAASPNDQQPRVFNGGGASQTFLL